MACIQPDSIFYLVNAKGGTALDLSGADNFSIIGYGLHKGPNQAWIFQSSGAPQEFYIRSVGSGQYLAPEGPPEEGQKIVALPSPFPWRVEDVPGLNDVVRILALGTPFCVDLSDYGNSTQGTPVRLYGRWEGENQLWRLQKAQ